MSKFLAAAFFGLSFGLSASAALAAEPIATLIEIEGGRVSVNQGEGFAPAVEGMRLKPGDRVMAQDDNSAEINFDDGCKPVYEVEENQIVTVPDRSTCAGGVPLVQSLTPTGGAAIGSAGAAGTVGPGNVAGGLIVVGFAAAGLCWLKCDDDDDEDDDDTVSP